MLVSGAVLLFGLILFVHWTEPPGHRTRHPQPDLGAFEQLTSPPLPADRLVSRAEEFLIERGYETEPLVGFLWPTLNELSRLTPAFSPEEIIGFADRGAPLVKWSVTFYDPGTIASDWPRLVVSFDQHGRFCEFKTYSHTPQSFPRDRFGRWLESRRLEIAGWMDVDPARLDRREVTNRMFDHPPYVGATWSAGVLDSNGAELVIGMHQRENSFRAYRTLALHDTPLRATPGFEMPKGFAFWASMMLSALLAFGIGLARTDTPAAGLPFGALKALLLTGIGLVVVMGLTQAVAMPLDEWYAGLFVVGFLTGAAALTWLWISVRRHDLRRSPASVGRGLRILFVAAVPAGYAVASFACLGWSFEGCCRACTLVRYAVAPLVALAMLMGLRDRRFLAFALILGGVGLVPHCVCGNVINSPWIEWLGGSPMCYLPGFAAVLLAVSGLSGVRPRFCAALMIGAGAVVLVGSVGHTVFRFPW